MKTTLKTAKFTFKTAVARFICGENAVRKRQNVCGVRRFLCVIQMIARFICGENAVRKQQNSVRKRRNGGAEMAKMWCGNGKIVVYLRRIHAWFPAFRLPRWRNGGAIAAVGGVVAAVSMCYSDDCKVYLR